MRRSSRTVEIVSFFCAGGLLACGGPADMPDAAVAIDSAMPPAVDAPMMPRPDARMPPGTDAFMEPMPDAFMEAPPDAFMEMPDAFAGEPCMVRGMSETLQCGMCGTQTRFCTSAMVWEYSECTGEHGVCEAGTTMDVPCGAGGTVTSRCNDACVYVATGLCSAPLWSCAMPLVAPSREGTVSVSSDTSAGGPGPLDLGMTCGIATADPLMRPAQVVVSYLVPGTGMRTVRFTTGTDATPANFDTLIQVRRGMCATAPTVREGSCFDDGLPPSTPPAVAEYRTLGTLVATGGETLYFVVTGLGSRPTMSMTHINEGPFQLDITVGDVTPPTLTAATVETVMDAMTNTARVSVTGGDTSGDATGVAVTLLNAGGMALDTNGDMTVTAADDIRVTFDPPGVTGMMTFMATATDSFTLLNAITSTMATRARVRITDAVGAESAPLTVDITGVRQVGYGAACDMTRVCGPTLTCTGGFCAASAATIAACAAATPVALSGAPATASVSGMLPMGPAVLPRPAMCGGTGNHVLYTVTVPAGAFDLVASTVNARTAATLDTVVYALSTCANPAGGPAGACVDDAMGERRANLVVQNIAAGTYTVVVAAYGSLAAPEPFGLDVTLRPVLATGATCDPMGVMNRCSAGACPMGGTCP